MATIARRTASWFASRPGHSSSTAAAARFTQPPVAQSGRAGRRGTRGATIRWSTGGAMATTPPQHGAAAAASTPDSPQFAAGEDVSQLGAEITALVEQARWQLDESATGVIKTFYFKTYTKTLDFVSLVGIRCKRANHHPTMVVRFGSVQVHWTTHVPPGLSAKDIAMARFCDEQADAVGAVEQTHSAACKPGKKG